MTVTEIVQIVDLVDRVITTLGQRRDVTPRIIDAEARRLDGGLALLERSQSENLSKYHLVAVKIERLEADLPAARRAVEKARNTELRRLRERELTELEEELDHLSELRRSLEMVRSDFRETAAVVRRGQTQLRRIRDRIVASEEAAAAAEARAAALTDLRDTRRALETLQETVDNRVAKGRAEAELAEADTFVSGLILEETDYAYRDELPSRRPPT